MEQKLMDWFNEQKENNITVTALDLKRKSKEFIKPKFKAGFKASKGWLEKFLKRNNISYINKDNYDKDSTSHSESKHSA